MKFDELLIIVYNIQRILLNQTDKNVLFEEICNKFVENSNIKNAWINKFNDKSDLEIEGRSLNDSINNYQMSFNLSYNNNQYGSLYLEFNEQYNLDKNAYRLLSNIAKDVSLSIYKIENNNKRKKLEDELIESKNKNSLFLPSRASRILCALLLSVATWKSITDPSLTF